jgi:gliding motility-associated-like protein
MKLDANLQSGCFESNVTALTVVAQKGFRITQPTPILANGGTSVVDNNTYSITITDSVLCHAFPLLVASIHYADTCLGANTNFTADTAGVSYWHWDFGDVGNNDTLNAYSGNYTYSTFGNYTVTLIVGNGCEFDTTTTVVHIFNPQDLVNLGADTTKCKDSILTIGISSQATSYSWNTGDTTATIQITQAGTYILNATFAPCGTYSDTIIVSEKNCFPDYIPSEPNKVDCQVFLPNAFTPNGDGLNDYLKPIIQSGMQGFEFLQFEVINRWGQKVFSSTNPSDGWDGRHQGNELSTDSYFFYIRYKCNNDMKIYRGDVLLVR